MSRRIPATAVSVALLASHAAGAERRTIGKIDKRDPRLDELIAADAAIEVLADGFKWSEGPCGTRPRSGSSSRTCRATRPTPGAEGRASRSSCTPSGYTGAEPYGGREPGSNGLAFDAKGRLVLCQHGDRRVARLRGRRSS